MLEASIQYDPSYFELDYPAGDVPSDVGVCADVVIRSFRAIGLDLQSQIHEDMSSDAVDYAPCDIVAWDLGGGVTHIGIVSDQMAPSSRPYIIHHISGQPSFEDVLFNWRMIGRFRVHLRY